MVFWRRRFFCLFLLFLFFFFGGVWCFEWRGVVASKIVSAILFTVVGFPFFTGVFRGILTPHLRVKDGIWHMTYGVHVRACICEEIMWRMFYARSCQGLASQMSHFTFKAARLWRWFFCAALSSFASHCRQILILPHVTSGGLLSFVVWWIRLTSKETSFEG